MTELSKLYHSYWTSFAVRTSGIREPLFAMRDPPSGQYFQVALAGPGQIFSARLNGGRDRIAIEFCMLRDPDRTMFRHLKSHAAALETALRQPIEWSDKQNISRCHLIAWREHIDLFDRTKWDSYQAWQLTHLLKLHAAICPLL